MHTKKAQGGKQASGPITVPPIRPPSRMWGSFLSSSLDVVIARRERVGAQTPIAALERDIDATTVNPIGGVERLDAYYFAYTVTSKSLTTSTQNAVALVVVKSSVKIDNLDDDTFRVIVDDSFPSLTLAIRAQLYEKLAIIVLPTPPNEAKVTATTALEKLWETTSPSTTAVTS
ncbi:MAG: hypothetical protein Q9195_006103 [Heterodermia aff. obscurata]